MESKSHLLDRLLPQTAAIQLAEKKKSTDHDNSNLTAEAAPFYSHDTNILNTWSPQQNTARRIT